MVLDGSDCELIEGCQRGDPDAFRLLFEAYKDKIYSIALRYAGEEAVALDITQETFLKLLSNVKDFRNEARFDSWLYRLVVNCCLDYKRRSRKLVSLVENLFDAVCISRETTLHALLRTEFEQDVQRAVSKLPEDQRLVVILRYTEELPYEQIAEILGCSLGTVASRLNRAHKTLERRLSYLRRR